MTQLDPSESDLELPRVARGFVQLSVAADGLRPQLNAVVGREEHTKLRTREVSPKRQFM